MKLGCLLIGWLLEWVALATDIFVEEPRLELYPIIPNSVLQLTWWAVPGVWYQLEYADSINGPWSITESWGASPAMQIITTVPFNTTTNPRKIMRLKMTCLVPNGRMIMTRRLSDIIEDYSTYNYGFLSNLISNQPPKYNTSILETQRWSGTITISNECKYLYVQSDDGCMVSINGVIAHNTLGSQQAWFDLEKSFDCLGRLPEGSNRVQVTYANTVNDNAYPYDGITLYLVGSFTCANHFIEGTNTIFWYGGETCESTYRLNYTSDNIHWLVSSNLLTTSTNSILQTITVKPICHSKVQLSDWVEAQWYDACEGLNQTSRFDLTILRPRDSTILNSTVGIMDYGGQMWFALSNQIQVLDQFGGVWSNDCYVSSDSAVTSPDPLPAGISLIPDMSSVSAPKGLFSELFGIRSGPGTYDINQNRANRAHLNGFFGSTIDWIRAKYHCSSFGDNSIQISSVP